jgi:hypothetical protein
MNMINASIFNEYQQANEISSGTSNSTQRCPTINTKVQKQMKVLWTLNMQVFAWNFFLSLFLLFSFLMNKWPLKVSRRYMCKALMLNRNKFLNCATQVKR